MAIQHWAGNKITKLSTDALPTGPFRAGTIIKNTDNGLEWVWNGTTWIPSNTIINDSATNANETWSSNKIDTELQTKVNKVVGQGLSDENYTLAEKNKLAGLESSKFKGVYTSLANLQSAHPTSEPGAYADVDEGVGIDVIRYIWDDTDDEWIEQASGAALTAAQVKTLYESNSNTNAFTDQNQTDLASNTSARHNQNTDTVLDQGGTNETTAQDIRGHIDDDTIHFDPTKSANTQTLYNDEGEIVGDSDRTWNKTTKVERVQGYKLIEETSTAVPGSIGHNQAVKGIRTETIGSDTLTTLFYKMGNGEEIIIHSYFS